MVTADMDAAGVDGADRARTAAAEECAVASTPPLKSTKPALEKRRGRPNWMQLDSNAG
jgi:hypothetical protein